MYRVLHIQREKLKKNHFLLMMKQKYFKLQQVLRGARLVHHFNKLAVAQKKDK